MPLEKTYIQKGTDIRKDIEATYGIVLKSIPFNAFPELKELSKRDWAEEQGEDVHIPANPVFKAYDAELEFVYNGGLKTAKNMIYSLLQYVQGSEFNIWDEWKQQGLRCYYKSFSDSLFYRRSEDLVTFKVGVGVANPLCYGLKIDVVEFVALCECDLTIYWADGTSASYLNGETITRTIPTGNEFAVVVPSSTFSISSINYSDSKIRTTSIGYSRILSSLGVRYIKN